MQRASKKQREEFVAVVVRSLPSLSAMAACDFARRIMRLGATYGRLQEAQCNGSYPADDGQLGDEAAVCEQCESVWHRRAMKKVVYMREGRNGRAYRRPECPDCRTQAAIERLCEGVGVRAIMQGDPRGHTVNLVLGTSEVGVPTS